MTGFIAMQRDALNHPLLRDGERFRAWFWLVANAAWKPTKFDIRGALVPIERGQLCVSIRQLADEWGWSKSAVDRFLTRLETETMVVREAGQGRCILTICNYDKYQDCEERKRDTSGTPTGTPAGHQRDTKEQGNKETKEPNGSKARGRASRPDGVSEGTWGDFNRQRKKVFTDTACKLFISQAEKAGWPLEDAFAHATMRGWEGFNADWVEHRAKVPGAAAKPRTPAELAEFYRKIGRDDEAEEIERREAKRTRSTGPPRPIGEVLRAANEGR